MNAGEGCRIYLVTPSAPHIDTPEFADTLAAALDAGDVACLQLRWKDSGDDALRRAADRLMPVCHERGVAFLVNDRPVLAAAIGADGAHIGADDGDCAAARAALGPDAIVGVSCYDSRHRGIDAAEAGADYVAFGAFFPTATKQPRARADAEILRWWRDAVTVPCVAIGGIAPENAGALADAGADFLAVVSAVWDHPEGAPAAVRAFDRALAARRGGG